MVWILSIFLLWIGEKDEEIKNNILYISMICNIELNSEIPRDTLREFAKYIIPYIRDFTYSDEGRRSISLWMRNHPEYEEDDLSFDPDDEDDEY